VFRRELISRLRLSLFSIELPVYTAMIVRCRTLSAVNKAGRCFHVAARYNSDEIVRFVRACGAILGWWYSAGYSRLLPVRPGFRHRASGGVCLR